jgi:hypothetical protein
MSGLKIISLQATLSGALLNTYQVAGPFKRV